MSSKPKKDRDVNFSKTMVNKSEKEKETYARLFDQRLHPMIDQVEKLKTELEYFKKQHTVHKKQIEDLTKEKNELWQNNKMLGLVLEERTNISERLNSIKGDHEAHIKFRAEMEKTLAELKQKNEEEVKVLQELLVKVIEMCDNQIEQLEDRVKISAGVTVNAVKEREEERQSAQFWIEGLWRQNTKLRDDNELMDKNVKALTDKKDQMDKVIDDQKAQNMEMNCKCQRNIRALALEKKMKAMVEDEVDSLKNKNEDLKRDLSTEKEKHTKTAVDGDKLITEHKQALAEKVALEVKLRSTVKQRDKFITKVNCLEKKERHFQEELYKCVLSFEKAFPRAVHFREKEKVEFRDMFLNLKKKYVDGVEGIPFVGITKEFLEKQLNCLRTRCKAQDAALLDKTRELKSFERKYKDMVKSSEYVLFKQRQELIGPVNQIIQKAGNEEKEIGHLKSRVKDLELELKLEKQKGQKLASLIHRSTMGRCYEETPTPSQIDPRPLPGKSTFIQVRPKHSGRSAGMASPVYLPVESPSTPPFLNSDGGLAPVD